MEGMEKFCLRWNDFESNITQGFKELREEKDFFDVTIACDDNQVQAHKVIISACSPFFRNVLRRNPHQHPLLYLKGVKYKELLSILNFMYVGEVNVAQDELNSFLSVAEDLKVKGLTQSKTESKESKQPANQEQAKQVNRPKASQDKVLLQPSKRPRISSPPTTNIANITKPQQESVDEVQEISVVKTEACDPQVTQPSYAGQTATAFPVQPQSKYQDCNTIVMEDDYVGEEAWEFPYGDTAAYGENATEGMAAAQENTDPIAAREDEIMSLILKDAERKLFTCALCKFGASSRHKAFCHIESKHFQDSPVTYTCPFCGKTAQTKNAIGLHISRNHKHERGDSKNSLLFPRENSFY